MKLKEALIVGVAYIILMACSAMLVLAVMAIALSVVEAKELSEKNKHARLELAK